MIFTAFKESDSTIYYGQKRLALDSISWPTYYEMSRAYAYKGDLIKAQEYAAKLAGFKINHIGFTSKLDEVKMLIKQLMKAQERTQYFYCPK